MHGLGGKGPGFLRRENQDIDCLPIALAKQGYDVWLANGRGTQFSQEHEYLDVIADEATYWDFSFPELAQYDLTAMLTTISEETGDKKINYVGYSLGTTQMFYALQAPETKQLMMDTIDKFIAIAPTMVPSVEGTMSLSALSYPLYEVAVSSTDLKYQLFGPKFDERLESLENLLGFLAGPDAVQTYHAANDAIGGFEGVPTKLFLHLGQIIITERFQEFSDCFGTFSCHNTDLYKIDEI